MGAQQNAAIVTPSYAGDFERCRLLCESMDRYVTGYTRHYLLVASHDVERFRALETDRRVVVFLKPFDCGDFWRDGQMRLYRKSGGMHSLMDMGHRDWLANAGRALDLPAGQTSDHDYITTLIAWRRETVLDMLRRIETVHGRPWINVVASDRRFSECILYGRYVDEVLNGEGHFHDDRALCHIYWLGPELDETGIERFIAGMEPYQVAIGIQSFTETSLEPLRRVIG